MSFFKFKDKTFIGLDFLDHEIRLLQLKRVEGNYCVEKFVQGKDLTDLVKKTGTINCRAAMALPAHAVLQKIIYLPYFLSKKEIEKELLEHLNHYFPGIREPLVCDFIILGKKDQEHEIFITAAKSHQIETYRDLIQTAGLKLQLIDIDCYALARSFQTCIPKCNTTLFIVFDESHCRILLLEATKLHLHHAWLNVSQEELIKKIQKIIQQADSIGLTISQIMISGSDPFQMLQKQFHFPVTYFQPYPSNQLIALGLAIKGLKHV